MVENNDENSGPLTSLPVDRLKATDCNADHSCQFVTLDMILIILPTGNAIIKV